MKRTLFVMAVVLGFATAASAATLSVVSDQATYTPGDTITLTVTGDDQGALTYSLFGRLTYNNEFTSPGTVSQNLAGPAPWLAGVLENTDGYADAFNQIDGGFGTTAASNLPGVIAVITLIADSAGIVNVGWFNNLSFYDIQGSSPGTSFEIVPEPTTAAMLALGLFGLAFGGRRRS